MFASILLRVLPRVSTIYKIPHHCLSTSEIATALRPFYFAVHPDLFGQYPRERVVNEESLKQLNQYLEHLYGQPRYVTPLDLLFYIREPTHLEEKDTFRPVRFLLKSTCARETVQTVLQACQLSLDYLNSIPLPKNTTVPDRPIKWDPSFYHALNRQNPHAERRKKLSDTSLSAWLAKNVVKAKTKQLALEPIRQEIERLSHLIRERAGLRGIQWDSRWGLPQFRACLRRFLHMYKQHENELDLEGHTLKFGSGTGVCIQGDVILKCDDVPEHWLPFLASLHQHTTFLYRLPPTERYLSHLLNDIQIIRPANGPVVLAQDYLEQLRRLSSCVRQYTEENPSEAEIESSLTDVCAVVESAAGPLTVDSSGNVLIPSSCPAFLIIDFLNRNADKARSLRLEYLSTAVNTTNDIADQCMAKLGLSSLLKDEGVTAQQFETCCEKLLSHTGEITVSLQGCIIKVAKFYSVMSDGEMCIPWNWKLLGE